MKVFIQARSGSTRLPNKIGMDFCGKPLIHQVYLNIKQVWNDILVIIPYNDPIKRYLNQNHIPYMEGNEKDCLSRFWHCARTVYGKPNMRVVDRHIVRITADCPLIMPATLFYMINIARGIDFITNAPCVDGHDIEIMSYRCLDWAYRDCKDKSMREHVTQFMKQEGDGKGWDKMRQMGFGFAKYNEPFPIDLFPKLSIDTQEDFKRVGEIYAKLANVAG